MKAPIMLSKFSRYQIQQVRAQENKNLELLMKWYKDRHFYKKDKAVRKSHRIAIHHLIDKTRFIRNSIT